jgi:hypothetical protein
MEFAFFGLAGWTESLTVIVERFLDLDEAHDCASIGSRKAAQINFFEPCPKIMPVCAPCLAR